MRSATKANITEILSESPIVIVDFSAPWCGPCKALEPTLVAADGNPFPIVKVDIDSEPELAEAYGIRSVPTLIAFKGGEAVDVKVGALSPSALQKWLRDQA